MATAKKKVTPLVRQLREAIQRGKQQSLWNGIGGCADVLGMKRGTLDCQVNGYVKDESVIRATLERIGILLNPENSSQTSSPLEQLKEAFEAGMGKYWNAKSECARLIGVNESTFKSYFTLSPEDAGGPRIKKSILKVVRKIRRKLETAGPSVQSNLPEGPAIPETPARSSPQEAAPASAAENTANLFERFLNGLREQVAHEVRQTITGQQQPSGDAPTGIVTSPWYDRILAGVQECGDQNLHGVRFVLRASSFRKFKGKITQEEIDDTCLLIQEMRRRINVIAQNDNEEVRFLSFKGLADELDELFLAYLLLKEVCPSGAISEIERKREAFRAFRSKDQ